MDISSIVILGLGGAGFISAVVLLLTKYFGRSNKEKILDIFKSKVTKKKEQENITRITREQEIITKQIEIAESSCEETRKKVKEIVLKTAEEIQKVLKENQIAEIDKEIKEDWKDI